MGKQHFSTRQNNKVIPMTLDANFYFERALRHLNRNNYSKALKYFWRTVDIEPNNPVHYCNLAGILSEIGHFKESNELLLYVVENLDPKLTECYYYLANNYAYLEELEQSFKYVHRYLDESPEGEFAEDASEMLSFISSELDEIDDLGDGSRELYIAHYKAKGLLEEGKFFEAIKRLEEMVGNYPDFFPAKNNLALAYFYLGDYTKSIEQTKSVLDKESNNIHALCNLAIIYQHINEIDEYNFLIEFLTKLSPYNSEHLYKLATTFAILGEHEVAFKHFNKLISKDELNIVLMHYGAVAAYNTGRFDLAFKWWNKILKSDRDSLVAKYYLDVFEGDISNRLVILPTFCYQYELPIEQLTNIVKQSNHFYKEFTFKSMLWGLKNGENRVKESILLGLGFFRNSEAEVVLRDFLLNEDNSKHLKNKALLALEEMNAKPPYKLNKDGKVYNVDRQTPDFSIWKDNWLDVLEGLEKILGERLDIIELYDAKVIWFDFINKTFPNAPNIRKVEGWVAAIEYIVAKMHYRLVKYDILATRYNVSKQTIVKNVHLLQDVLDLKNKYNNHPMLNK